MKRSSDRTVPIAIAITITILVIFGIVLGTACKDKFSNIKNIGLFSNIENVPPTPEAGMFKKWRERLGKNVSLEEARERWNKAITGPLTRYSNLLSKPIEQLSQEEQKHRKLIYERIPPDELKRIMIH
jgi:hypothetical protein